MAQNDLQDHPCCRTSSGDAHLPAGKGVIGAANRPGDASFCPESAYLLGNHQGNPPATADFTKYTSVVLKYTSVFSKNTLVHFENTSVVFKNTLVVFENTSVVFENTLGKSENTSVYFKKPSVVLENTAVKTGKDASKIGFGACKIRPRASKWHYYARFGESAASFRDFHQCPVHLYVW